MASPIKYTQNRGYMFHRGAAGMATDWQSNQGRFVTEAGRHRVMTKCVVT